MTIIQKPTQMDEDLYASILHLLPQLNARLPIPTYAEVTDLIISNSSTLIVARYPSITSPIVGMVTVVIIRVPSGIHALIEDMVVDHELRNKGIGQGLLKEALQTALRAGANGVMLTSNSSRISAIRLYERLGFKKWDTNLFFYQYKH